MPIFGISNVLHCIMSK